MKTFIYYRKDDKSKEPIGHVNATDSYTASIKASAQKQLSNYEFDKLFELEEKKR